MTPSCSAPSSSPSPGGSRKITEGREADAAAKQLFAFSILYLFLLFAVILGEHAVTRLDGVRNERWRWS